MSTNVQTRRRFTVSVKGLFEDDAVPEMKRRIEGVATTKVETYDVYPAVGQFEAVANFRVETDATEQELAVAVDGIENITGVRTEELDAKQT